MSSSITDFPRPPVHGFRGDTPTPPPLTHPRGLSIAISREAGARGATIARKVGELSAGRSSTRKASTISSRTTPHEVQLLAEFPRPPAPGPTRTSLASS